MTRPDWSGAAYWNVCPCVVPKPSVPFWLIAKPVTVYPLLTMFR